MRHATITTIATITALALFGIASRDARAESSIIRSPGDHPSYRFEAEPHGLVGFGPLDNVGVGFRGTFVIVDNGFVKSINNNVGIGIGGDFFPRKSSDVFLPVVMQWNFFLSEHWSVFGEPGVGIRFHDNASVWPTFYAGGRYHFSDRIALTMRLGYPAISVGVSFFL